jgi:hypothetical protein
MLTTTLNEIRKYSPCKSGLLKLTEALGENFDPDSKIDLLRILETNGLDDALWALRAVVETEDRDRIARLFACDCAEKGLELVDNPDPRSLNAVEISRQYALGRATDKELTAARAAAWAAWAAGAAARAAARAAWAARDAARAAWAARDAGAAGAWQEERFIQYLRDA